jgi:hypothetical protein
MIDNKLSQRKAHYELATLPPWLLASPGIKIVSLVLEPRIAPESVLLVIEEGQHAREFEGRDLTSFNMKSGLVRTAYGPVYWLLFSFPSPAVRGMVTYEMVVNPTDADHLTSFYVLAEQKYWHVVIADSEGQVANLFEFPNNYGLGEALENVREICVTANVSDFMAAKAEYQARYTVEDLLKAGEA